MKKLLYSSVVLIVFSLSIILFQISCQEEAFAKGVATQNKFLYTVFTSDMGQFWIMNINGTNPTPIPINLPDGLKPTGSGKLTPDGNTLIFSAYKSTTPNEKYIYSVSINGTNLKKLLDKTITDQLDINQTF